MTSLVRLSFLPRVNGLQKRLLSISKPTEGVKLAATIRAGFPDDESAAKEFSKLLWKLNHKRQHRIVAEAFDVLPTFDPMINPSVTRAALLANAEMRKSFRVKEILEEATYKEINSESLSYLLRAYTLDSRLGSAERLMYSWLNRYCERHPSDEFTPVLRDSLHKSQSVQSQTKGTVSAFEFSKTDIGDQSVPLSAWVSMVCMYKQRGAWKQCWEIMKYLESMRTFRAEYKPKKDYKPRTERELKSSVDLVSRFVSERPHLLENMPFEYGTEFSTGSDVTEPILSHYDKVVALQWSSIYHQTLRVLCDCAQYDLALHLFHRMSNGKDVADPAYSFAEIPAIISLLHGFISPVINSTSNVDKLGTIEKSGTPSAELKTQQQLSITVNAVSNKRVSVHREAVHTDSYENSIHMRREMVTVLIPEITNWITESIKSNMPNRHARITSVRDENMSKCSSSNLSLSLTHKRKQRLSGARVSDLLSREFLLVLCRLDMLAEAKEFVTVVLQCLLDIRYSQMQSKAVGRRRLLRVGGFTNDLTSWVSVYAQRLREAGDWEELNALYSQLEKIEKYEEQLKKSAGHSSPSPSFSMQDKPQEKEDVEEMVEEDNDDSDDDDDDSEEEEDDDETNEEDKQLVEDDDDGDADRVQKTVIAPRRARKSARRKLFLFHDTASALRKSGQLGKLADVMSKRK